MRNEIFNRISQNRNQYYSELKNTRIEPKIYLDSLSESEKLILEKSQKPEIKSILIQGINLSRHIVHSRYINSVLIQLFQLLSHVRSIIQRQFNHLVNNADRQTDKLTDGLINISSQLFEDKYEFQESSNELSDNLKQNEKHSTNFSMLNISGSVISLPYSPDRFNLENQIFLWLKRIYLNILIFLESDNWIEEINKSHKSTTPALDKLKTIDFKTSLVKLKVIIKRNLSISKVKQSFSVANNADLKNIVLRYYRVFNKFFKALYSTFFPAINRFI